MSELLLLLVRTKSEVVSALQMKTLLGDKGIEISGLVLKEEDSNKIPAEFLEDIMQLKILGSTIPNDGIKCQKCGATINLDRLM
jgi:hypothetical protein